MTESRPAVPPPTEGPSTDDVSDRFWCYRRTRDLDLRNRLVVEHCWLADHCARRYVDRGEPLADLCQVARLGLVKAVERFEPDRGVAFTSFARPTVIGELKRHFRDRCWSVSVPRPTKDRRARVLAAAEELEQSLARPARDDEIADLVHGSEEQVRDVLDANRAYRTEPLEVAVGDMHPVSDDEPADAVSALDAVASLDERSRRIIYLRFFEDRTQREIGDRIGVGQVQVSRLIHTALRTLRDRLTERPEDCAAVATGRAPAAGSVRHPSPS